MGLEMREAAQQLAARWVGGVTAKANAVAVLPGAALQEAAVPGMAAMVAATRVADAAAEELAVARWEEEQQVAAAADSVAATTAQEMPVAAAAWAGSLVVATWVAGL